MSGELAVGRPPGDPMALRGHATRWAGAAEDLRRTDRALAAAVADAVPARWAGRTARRVADRLTDVGAQVDSVARALELVADALIAHARVLESAQQEHDLAAAALRRAADNNTDRADLTGWAVLRLVQSAQAAADRAGYSAIRTAAAIQQARALVFSVGLAPGPGGGPLAPAVRTDPSWSIVGHYRAATFEEWSTAIGVFCGDVGYEGGGFVTGPDGRDYAVVVPYVRRDGQTFYDDGAALGMRLDELDGLDPGWRSVYEQRGIAELGHQRADDSVGVLTRAVTPQLGGHLQIDPGLLPAVVSGAPLGVRAEPRDPGPVRLDDAVPTHPLTRVVAGLDATRLAAGGALAVRAFLGRDTRAYQVMFEEHPDGRRRARIRTFQGYSAPGRTAVETRASWVGADGRLVPGEWVREGPDAGPQLRQPGVTAPRRLFPVGSWPSS